MRSLAGDAGRLRDHLFKVSSSIQSIEFNIDELQRADLNDYKTSACRAMPPTSGHLTWTLQRGRRTLVFPAIVLLRGLFGLGNYTHLLFRPNSPYEYLPLLARDLKRPLRSPPSTRALAPPMKGETHANRETLRTLLWITAFPSALRGWESVRRYGANGTLGCDLPEGVVAATIRASRHGNTSFVNALQVHQIATKEQPLPLLEVPVTQWNLLGRWNCFNRGYYWDQTNNEVPFPERPRNVSWENADRISRLPPGEAAFAPPPLSKRRASAALKQPSEESRRMLEVETEASETNPTDFDRPCTRRYTSRRHRYREELNSLYLLTLAACGCKLCKQIEGILRGL